MAFMGEDSWKAGLSGLQMSKISDMEEQLSRVKKDRSEKAMQVELLTQTLQKKELKMEEDKSRAIQVQREVQILQENCSELEKTRDKLAHDLSAKEVQNNSLLNQLDNKTKQLDSVMGQLKRMEKMENDCTNSFLAPSTPLRSSVSTPQKRSFTMAMNDGDDVHKQLLEAHKTIEELNQVNKDLEVKLFEKSAYKGCSTSFDDTPLPTLYSSAKKGLFDDGLPQPPSCSMGFSQIAQRSKSSSIVFGDEQPLQMPFVSRHPAAATHLDHFQPSPAHQVPALPSHSATANSNTVDLLDAARKECDLYKKALSEKEAELVKVLAELAAITHQTKSSDDLEKQQLKSQLASLKSEQGQQDKATVAMKDLNHELLKLRDEKEKLEERMKQIQRDADCMRHNSEAAKQSLEKKCKDQEREIRMEMQQLMNECKEQTRQLQDKANRQHAEHQKTISGLQEQVLTAQTDLKKAKDVNIRLQEEMSLLKQLNADLNAAASQNQALLEEAKKQGLHSEKEMDELKQQLKQVHDECAQLRQLKAEAEAQQEKWQGCQQMSEQLEELRMKYEAAVSGEKEACSRVQQCEQRYQDGLANLQHLEEVNQSHATRIQQLEQLEKEAVFTKNELQEEVSSLKNQLVAAQKLMADMEEGGEKELADLTAQRCHFEQRLLEHEKTVQTVMGNWDQVLREHGSLTEQRLQDTEQLQSLQSDLSRAKSQLQLYLSSCSMSQSKLQADCDKLREELASCQEQETALKKDQELLLKQLSSRPNDQHLTDQLHTLTETNGQLLEQLQQSQTTVDTLTQQQLTNQMQLEQMATQLTEARETIAQLGDQSSQNQSQWQSLQDQYQRGFESWREERDNLSSTIDTLSEAKERLQSEHQDLTSQLQDMTKDALALHNRLTQYLFEKEVIQTKMAEMEADVQKKEQLIGELQQRLKAAEENWAQAEERQSSSLEQLQILQHQLNESEEEKRRFEKKWNNQNNQLVARVEAQLEALTSQCHSEMDHVARLEVNKTFLTKELADLMNRIDELESRNASYNQNDSLDWQASQDKVKTLSRSYDDKVSELSKMQQKYEHLHELHSELQQRLQDYQLQSEQMTGQRHSEHEHLQLLNQELLMDKSALQNQLQVFHDQVAQFQQTQQEYKAHIDQLNSEITSLTDEKEKLEERCGRMHEQNESAMKSLEHISEQVASDKLKSKESEMAMMKIQENNKLVAKMQEQLEAMTNQYYAEMDHVARLEVSRSFLVKEVADLMEKIDEMGSSLANNNNEELKSEIEKKAMLSQMALLTQTLNEKLSDVAKLEQKCDKMAELNCELQQRLQDHQLQSEQMAGQRHSEQEHLQLLNQELLMDKSALQNQLEVFTGQVAQFQQAQQDYKAQIDLLHSEIASVTGEKDRLEDQCGRLHEQYQSSLKALERLTEQAASDKLELEESEKAIVKIEQNSALVAKMHEQLEALTNQYYEEMNHVARLEVNNTFLIKEVADLMDKIDESGSSLANENQAEFKFDEERKALMDQVARLTQTLDSKLSDAAIMEQKCNQLQDQLKANQLQCEQFSSLSKRKEELEEECARISELHEFCSKTCDQLREQVSLERAKAQEQCQSVMLEKEQWHQRFLQQEKANAESQENLLRSQAEVQSLQDILSRSEFRLEEIQKALNIAQSEKLNLEEQYETLIMDKLNVIEELDEMKRELAAVTASQEQTQSNWQQMQDKWILEKDDWEKEKEEITSLYRTTLDDLAEVKRQHADVATQKASLEESLDQLKEQLLHKESLMADLKHTAANAESKLAQMEEEKSAFTRMLAELKSSSDQDRSELERKISQQEEVSSQLAKQKALLTKQLAELSGKLDEAADQLTKSLEQNDTLQHDHKGTLEKMHLLEQAVDKSKEKLAALEGKLAEKDTELTQMEAERDEARESSAALSSEKLVLESQLEEQTKAVSQQQTQLSQQLDQHTQEKQQWQLQIQSLKKDNQELEKSKSNQQNRVSMLLKQQKKLEKMVESLSQENEQLSALKEEHEQLQQQIRQTQEQMVEIESMTVAQDSHDDPWVSDPEMSSLNPKEVKDLIWDELTLKQKFKILLKTVSYLDSNLETQILRENDLSVRYGVLKKDLDRAKAELDHVKRQKVRIASQTSTSSQETTAFSDKALSSAPDSASDETAVDIRMTRSRSRGLLADVQTSKRKDNDENQGFVQNKRLRGLSRRADLPQSKPENVFLKSKDLASQPLGTITNKKP